MAESKVSKPTAKDVLFNLTGDLHYVEALLEGADAVLHREHDSGKRKELVQARMLMRLALERVQAAATAAAEVA